MDRKKHIDIAKFLGIGLIVLGHNSVLQGAGDSYLFGLIYAFHVPLFFFLSGCFMSIRRGLKDLVVSRLDSLLKPYFVVSTLLIIKSLLEGSISLSYVYGILYGNGLTIEWIPMWFLTHLFVASIVSYAILYCFFSRIKLSILKAAFSLGTLFIGSLYIKIFWLGDGLFFKESLLPGLPFSLDLLWVTVPYILLGAIYNNNVKEMKENHLLGLLSIIIVLVINAFSSAKVDLNLRNYDGFLVVNLKILFSVYMVLYMSIVVGKFKFAGNVFAYAGQSSLFILIFHFYIQAKSYDVLIGVFGAELIALALSFILGLILPILMYWIAMKSKWVAIIMLPIKTNKSMQPIG